MASSIQLLRSTNAQERPFPGNLLEGQPAVNLNASEPGLFFKAADGSLVKFGPAAITSDGSPPNSSPQGLAGNTIGELWLDKSVDPAVLKVYDGAAWVDAGSGSGGSGGTASFVRWIYTAAGGETSLSGSSGGVLLEYTPGLEEVYVNGVLITRGTDYSATNGTSITNLSALTAGDVITVTSLNPLETVQLPGQVTLLRWATLATAGQTTLSGVDSSGQQLTYTSGFEEVYVNGAFLRRGIDYVATNGNTITGLSPLTEDDEITVMAWSPFSVGSQIVDADVAANASISSTKLEFLQSGTSAVSRTVQNKLRESISVKDFGAAGDGVTDDTAAFNLALRAAETYGDDVKYICLQLGGGNYRIDGTVFLRKGQVLDGGGARLFMGATGSIKLGFRSDDTQDPGGAPPGVLNLWIEGGLIPINGAGINGYQISNIFFSSSAAGPVFSGTDGTISNCVFDNGSTLATLSGRNMTLSNCVFYIGNTQLSLNCKDSVISNCVFSYPNVTGVDWVGGPGKSVTNTIISNCAFLKNEQTVSTFSGFIRTLNTTVAPIGDLTVNGCTFRNCAGGAIRNFGTSTHRLIINNCIFDGTKTFSAYTQSSSMFAVDMSSTGFSGGTTVLRGCSFLNLKDTPIKVSSAQLFILTVDECTFTNNSGSQSISVSSSNSNSVFSIGNCVGDAVSNTPLITLNSTLDFRVTGYLKDWLPILDDGVANKYVEVPFVGPTLLEVVLIANQNPGLNNLCRSLKKCTASVSYDFTTQLVTRATIQDDFLSASPISGFDLNIQAALSSIGAGTIANGVLSPEKIILYWPSSYGDSSIDIQYKQLSIKPS